MFNAPALLMRAKKKESIFKDCWPLYNYSLKIIPELTEPIYVAPTTAQKTMQVVYKDMVPPIEVGNLIDISPPIYESFLIQIEMSKFYSGFDGVNPAASTLIFNDSSDYSVFTLFENDDLEAFCSWLSKTQGTTDPATLVDSYLSLYDKSGALIRGFTFTVSLGEKTKTAEVDYFSALQGDGKGARVPDVIFSLLDEGGGAIICEIGNETGFQFGVPVAANSYSDSSTNDGKCGEPFWDMLYESYETKTPVTIETTLWLSPTVCPPIQDIV